MKSIISRLIAWTRKEIRSKILCMYPPPPVRYRIADILAQLGPGWAEESGYFALTVPKVNGPLVDFNYPTGGFVLKAFINNTTGEVRTYVAKWLDIPEQDRIYLWALNPPISRWERKYLNWHESNWME